MASEIKIIKYNPDLDISNIIIKEKLIVVSIREYLIEIKPGYTNFGSQIPNHYRVLVYDEKTNQQLPLIRIFSKEYVDPDQYERNVTIDKLKEMLSNLYNFGSNDKWKTDLKNKLYKQLEIAEPFSSWTDELHYSLYELNK